MNVESLRSYCLGKEGATEDLPFGADALAIRVADRMFALIKIGRGALSVNLKCDPALAVELRKKYPSVTPGYHMNKTHWNTVALDGSIPDGEIRDMIDHSYEMVLKGLKKG
ncbi:MAG: MmcQ/YjbR family DNA-binding protein [Chloroflexi bacterium]|nr:MmcQ/YjbR family DNA-binding protein [Chloroflexota bacterium]